MRHTLIYLLIVLLCPAYSVAQCPDGDIILDSQAKIDSFRSMYPNCTEIQSDLIVGIYDVDLDTTSNIQNVDSLISIQSVMGSIYILQNDSIEDLKGLDSLVNVSSNFVVAYNNNIANLEGLTQLETVGRLDVRGNLSMKDFQGLERLRKADEMYFEENDSLINFEGANQLDSVGYFAVFYNKQLQNFQGFNNIKAISGDFIVVGNTHLITLEGLDALNAITDNVHINNNDNLSDCSVLGICHQLKMNPASLIVYDNAVGCASPDEILDSCGYNLECPPGVTFYSQEKINNFTQRYPNCTCINGNVLVDKGNYSTDVIQGFDSLHNISVIKGDLEFVNIGAPNNFTGLESLDSIYGNLDIAGMQELQSFIGLDGLTSIGGRLEIRSNPKLKSISELSSLEYLGSSLFITGNDSLLSINGLHNIDTVKGDLYLRKNALIRNCVGLDSLKVIKRYFQVWDNDSLVNFEGLGSLEKIGTDFYVGDNFSLLNFEGLQNLDSIGFIGSSGSGGYNGLYQGYIWNVGGKLHIQGNERLLSMVGLENVSYVRGSLAIGGNPTLQNLYGLESLHKIGGYLYIYANDKLTSLELLKLNEVSFDIGIKNNSMLSRCDIELVCNELKSSAPYFTYIIIENNSTGCYDELEVLSTCSSCPNCILSVDNNWLGGTDNNWHTASNWSTGEVPTECDNVSITNGSEVHVLGDAVCNTIDVEEGAVLNVQDHLLRVACEN